MRILARAALAVAAVAGISVGLAPGVASAQTLVAQSSVTITSDNPNQLSGTTSCKQWDVAPGQFGDYEISASVGNRTLPAGSHYKFDLFPKSSTVTPIATVEHTGTTDSSAVFHQYADGIERLQGYRIKATQVTPSLPNPNVLVGWVTTTGQCGWANMAVVPHADLVTLDANKVATVRVANDTAFARTVYVRLETSTDTGETLQSVLVPAKSKANVVASSPITGPALYSASTGALGGLNGSWTYTSGVVVTGSVS